MLQKPLIPTCPRRFVLGLLLSLSLGAQALPASKSPLEPEDTSSPKATLFGFIDIVNARFAILLGPNGYIKRYIDSGRLYPTKEEYNAGEDFVDFRRRSASFLDTSGLPEVERAHEVWRLTVQLKEVLDRLRLPDPQNVPDADSVARSGIKRWVIPGTELHIDLIEAGPMQGKWLFSKDTVAALPEDYQRMKDVPYVSLGSPGFYDFTFHVPSGIAMLTASVLPPRWFFDTPSWMKATLMDQPLWRWMGFLVVLSLGFTLFWISARLTKRMTRHKRKAAPLWYLLPPATLMLICQFMIWTGIEILRVSPIFAESYLVSIWVMFFLAMTYFVWLAGGVIAEWLIALDRIQNSNLDGQVIRLTLRILSLVVAIAVLVEGANRIGLPSYSVVAGLGVGGLAAALAGQQAIANLIGSLIIMFEKPFRVGHQIKTGEVEGTVEDVGFRCTLIRTPENTFLSVPSSILVTHTIENQSLRKNWRIKRLLYLNPAAAPQDVAWLVESIRALLDQHQDIKTEKTRVALIGIGLHGFEVQIDFHIKAVDEKEQMGKCNAIFLEVIQMADSRRIAFMTSDN